MSERNSNPNHRLRREARLRWVYINKMKMSPFAQRELRPHWVSRLAAEMELEQLGVITVSLRDGSFYVIDGQHRIEALRVYGFGDEQIQCWCYEGLTEEDEAEMFLVLNSQLAVSMIEKFKKGVVARRPLETEIDKVVQDSGLAVSKRRGPNCVSAVSALYRVHARTGADTLGRTLRLAHDAYGEAGLESIVIEGLGLLCHRYNGHLDDDVAATKLMNARGGVNGLLAKAETLRRQTGSYRSHCVAAAAVEIINAGRGGNKLPSWWKVDG